MFADRILDVASMKSTAWLALGCLVLGLALIGSIALNVWQVSDKAKAVGQVEAKLAALKAGSEADLRTCAATNRNNVATVQVLGDELHACRGQEQKISEQRDLAMRQRDRARRSAEGEARMRSEAVEAIARTHEDCRRPVCRALSDELLRKPAGPDDR